MGTELEELRQAVIAKVALDIDDTHVIISNSKRLPRKTATNFHSMRGRGDAYLLEAVFFQYRFRDLPYNDYIEACRKERVAHFTPLDKKDLLAYLTGQVETCASIVARRPETSAPSDADRALPDGVRSDANAETSRQEPSTQRAKEDTSFSTNRKRPRDQRSLDSVLMVRDWDFTQIRDKLSQHVADSRKGKANVPDAKVRKSNASTYDPRGDRYNTNEDRVWRENLGSDFQDLGIDMSGSFKDKPSAAPPSTNGSSASKERDRSGGRRSSSSSAVKRPESDRKNVDPRNLVPIIIVPSGSTTLISAANALEFFDNARFLSYEELRKNPKASTGVQSRITFHRKPGGNCSKAEYHIVSNPNRLTESEWDRVVAVVCSGQEWQFKKWPIHDGGLQDLFRKVQGFYFHYDDVAPTKQVETWPIKKLRISKEKRHTDGQVQSQFWLNLDNFIRRKGKHLRY